MQTFFQWLKSTPQYGELGHFRQQAINDNDFPRYPRGYQDIETYLLEVGGEDWALKQASKLYRKFKSSMKKEK
jgi:uncharacterized protein YozE (UPF0346 family)